MANRRNESGDDRPSVVPLRQTTDGRRSRLADARRYQPRGRTVAERPFSLVETDGDDPPRQPARGKSAKPARARSTRAAPARTQTRRTRTADAAGRPRPKGRGRAAARRAPVKKAGRTPRRPRRILPRPRLADAIRRLRLGTFLVLALFAVIGLRLVEIQITDAKAYAEQGLELRLETIDLPAPRGRILDRDGNALAESVEARYVYADPSRVENPARTADALSPLLAVPRSELLPKLRPHTRDDGRVVQFEWLARGVDISTADAVSALHLAGIGVHRDERRVVPGKDLAANVIGFTGRDLAGLAGLEASYDELLRGVDGERTFETGQPYGGAGLGREVPSGYHQETPARPGSSLQLTIDRDLQFEVQRILAARLAESRAHLGAAVVLDVKTGDVLAQASYPSYDAANPFAYARSARGDVASGQPFDPGSVHKAIVFAAAIEEGVVNPDSTVLVTPTIRKGDKTYTDTHRHAKPTVMTLPGILAYSSNVGTISVASQLGADKLYEYQRKFGLGQSTEEGLPGESAGLVRSPKNWSGSSYGSIPIGMGVSATPLQMAAAYAAIANDGVWIRPRLIQATISADGTSTPAAASPTHRVISATNAAALRTMMEAVVTVPHATGRSAAIDGYRVAGKTGTGMLLRDGQYASGEVASFIGIAPADAPRYVIAVFGYTPGGTGGVVAGPAFKEMMEFTLRHYRVPPTGTQTPQLRAYP